MRYLSISAACLLPALIAGCLNIGPTTIVQDRFNYNVAIRDSWQEQILANVVSLRYGEAPVFLDVDSVIAQYGLETRGSLAGGINNSFTGDNAATAGGSVIWQERPTITYTPVSGREFTINLLTPISPDAIFSLIDAGWNIERSLLLILQSINGVTDWDPLAQKYNQEFFAVLRAFKTLQDRQALGIRRDMQNDGVRTFIYLRDVDRDSEIDAATSLIGSVLKLRDEFDEFEIVYGTTRGRENRLTVQTLSILDIMNGMAQEVIVPDQHVADGRTGPNRDPEPTPRGSRIGLVVRSATERPDEALVAIQNRDYWFYIDDRDLESKKSLSFLMVLLNVSAAQEEGRSPVVTISTGG